MVARSNRALSTDQPTASRAKLTGFPVKMSIENWRIFQDSITGRWGAEHRASHETVYADTNAKVHEEVEEFEKSRASLHLDSFDS